MRVSNAMTTVLLYKYLYDCWERTARWQLGSWDARTLSVEVAVEVAHIVHQIEPRARERECPEKGRVHGLLANEETQGRAYFHSW